MTARAHLSEALALLPHIEHLSPDAQQIYARLHAMLDLLGVEVEPVMANLPRLRVEILRRVRKAVEAAYWAAAWEAAIELSMRGDVVDDHVRKVVGTIVTLGEHWNAVRTLLLSMRAAAAQRAVA